MTEMNHAERLSLNVDSPTELARNRTILAALADIRPRSEAGHHLRLAPDFTVDKAQELLKEFSLIYKEIGRSSVSMVLRKDAILIHASLTVASLRLDVLAGDDTADKILESLLTRFEPYIFINEEEDGIWAEFTYSGGNGLTRQTQFLRCPTWKDIQGNYPSSTRSAMERLVGLKAPWKSGRLVIWHGSPGTGKTYAIRALLQAWKERFDFIVINDPENFAASPAYYYQVSSRSYQWPGRFKSVTAGLDEDDDDERDAPKSKRKRHMFLLEDSADLIMQESRTSHYDKLGKLLNMTDGLFGQGREDLFLLTFNEEVTRIDPAFLRPGRCLTKIEFPKFTPEDGVDWLGRHGLSDARISQDISLAELYAKILSPEGTPLQVPIQRKQIGFGK
jgi:hypothetical protein